MINGGVSDETDSFLVDPFPECDILVHDMGFEFRLQFEIEDLELSLCLKSDDFRCGMHNGTIGCDGSAHDVTIVMEVDDYYLVRFIHFFTNTKQDKSD